MFGYIALFAFFAAKYPLNTTKIPNKNAVAESVIPATAFVCRFQRLPGERGTHGEARVRIQSWVGAVEVLNQVARIVVELFGLAISGT